MPQCELCGTPVEVVGDTTKHYEPRITPEAVAELKKRADAMAVSAAKVIDGHCTMDCGNCGEAGRCDHEDLIVDVAKYQELVQQ